MRQRLWHYVSGAELESCYVGSRPMAELVPPKPAVYAWRRNFRPPPELTADPVSLAEWIAETTRSPCASIPPRELSHYLLLHGISIGGAPLTEAKLHTLRCWASEPRSRRWLMDVIESIRALAPPLYVGESDNLARRVKEHLGLKTDFSLTLSKQLKLVWQDCDLWYCLVPEEHLATDAQGRRTLVELVVARLTVAGCTSRPG